MRQIGIDDHDYTALRFGGATARHRAVAIAVARVEHANVEIESGCLQKVLDRLHRRRQLRRRPKQRYEDRHGGRAHAPILVR